MAKRLVIFNHKGGVSKTTSAFNLGWAMAKQARVLLVDGDPQCNLTSLVLGEEFERYYTDEATRKQNIKDGASPAFDGKPEPIRSVACISPPRSPNLFLLAGHANLAEYDAPLTFAHTANSALPTLQNLPGAFSALIRETEHRYNIDYTIIDLNPGLSAINQNLFLSGDAFVVPTNPDPFSLMALDTLTTILPRWSAWKAEALRMFANAAYPIREGEPHFLGTLVQRFNIRKGVAARPYRENIEEINDRVAQTLFPALRRAGMTLADDEYGEDLGQKKYCLGQIPDFQGLLPKSYAAGVPVYDLADTDFVETGPILAGFLEKREVFRAQFTAISHEIVRLMAYA